MPTQPSTGQKQVTISGKVINHVSKVCFLVTHVSKAERLKEIWAYREKAKLLPAAQIHPANGNLRWYVDKAAAQATDEQIPLN